MRPATPSRSPCRLAEVLGVTAPSRCLPPSRRRRGPALLLSLALLLTSGCIPFLIATGEGDGHAEKRRWEQAEAACLRALSFLQSADVEQKLRRVRELWSEDLGRPDASPAWYTEQHVAEDEDETHVSYLRYGVSGDPLNLRSEWQLCQEAADRALAAVAAQVGRHYEAWRSQQAESARRERQQSPELGREATVRALLVYTGQPPEDLARWLSTTQGLANTGQLRCP